MKLSDPSLRHYHSKHEHLSHIFTDLRLRKQGAESLDPLIAPLHSLLAFISTGLDKNRKATYTLSHRAQPND